MIKRNCLAWDRALVEYVEVISDRVVLGDLAGYVVRPTDGTCRQWLQTAENLEPQDAIVRQLNVVPFPPQLRVMS